MISYLRPAGEAAPVPFRALLLSVLAFSVPLMGATIAPEWALQEQGVLLWLTALLPPFLLTYYRGWEGASIGLAAGMAAVVVTHLGILLLELGDPNYGLVLWIVGTYIVVCLGSGMMGELLKRERRLAEEMALTDRLTQLPNHRHAAVFLDAAFSAAARGQPVSVVRFSLDRFDELQERFGEETGSQVLRRFGAILIEVTRRMDLSARWEGREFVSILSKCKAGGAASFTVRVLEELRADVFPWGRVTASAGIAEFETGMGSLEVLLAAGDRALNAARAAGGDRHMIAGTRSEVFQDRQVPLNPSAQRGSLRLETIPNRGFQLVPRVRTEVSEGDPDGASGSSEVEAPKGTERILVVDDDHVERVHLVKALQRFGYEVSSAPDGKSALDDPSSIEEAELLVVDLIMPRMGGFTFVDECERLFGPKRVLYLAGNVQEAVHWRGAPGSQVGFVSKPSDPTETATTLRQLLDRSPSPVPGETIEVSEDPLPEGGQLPTGGQPLSI